MRNRITKGNGTGSSAFRRLTRGDLTTFDGEAKELILKAMERGCVGRVSSRGHAILRNNTGGSASVPRNMTSPNRTAQNTRADVKRLLAEHRSLPSLPADAAVRTAPRQAQRLTVSQAFVEHPAAFSRWFDALAVGLPADQELEVSFDEAGDVRFTVIDPPAPTAPAVEPEPVCAPRSHEPAPALPCPDCDRTFGSHRRIHRAHPLTTPPESRQEVGTAMSIASQIDAEAPTSHREDPEEILRRVRAALGEDPPGSPSSTRRSVPDRRSPSAPRRRCPA